MIKTKVLSILATSVLIAASITACGDDDDDAAATGGGADADGADADGADEDGADEDGDETTGAGAGGGDDCTTLAEALGDFASLAAAATQAGIAEDVLAFEGKTIFAPTDEAFAQLLVDLGGVELSALTPAQLIPILNYHVIDGEVLAADALKLTEATTLGGDITLKDDGGSLVIDADEANAKVTTADVMLCNDVVVHVVDAVLLPSVADIVTTGADYSNLLAAVTATGDETSAAIVSALDDADATLTLFAPTNDALAPVLENAPANLATVLQYHVYGGGAVTSTQALAFTSDSDPIEMLAGGEVSIDGSTGDVVITDATDATVKAVAPLDIKAFNGTIHSIDGVLLTEVAD
jgi:uncharacterized surface protein with fasciclin (FAS1) repeats